MATTKQVLKMLLPDGGYVSRGENFEDIEFIEAKPITKSQFEAGFAQFDAWQSDQDSAALATKQAAQAKLTALGLTTDDLKALGL
jgi:hypothetical protein